MADARLTQGRIRALVAGNEAQASQARVRAVFNFPSEEGQLSQARVRAMYAGSGANDVQVSQMRVRALIAGRVANPKIRRWTFTLDQHDFIVTQLGAMDETLVYDTHSGQYSLFVSGMGTGRWRAATGINWTAGRALGALYGSDVICGDDATGALYWLAPESDTDDDWQRGSEVQRPFVRTITGQAVLKPGYNVAPCYGVQLYGSIGAAAEQDLTVKLEVSDDRGRTYLDMGEITLDAGDYDARAHWRSLGSIRVPGRLFRVTDYGALRRVDSLEMDEPR